jgi:type I restriction enzyme S subunit
LRARSGFTCVSESTHEKLKRSILDEDDVLLTIAGAQVGRCGIVRAENLPANTNQAVGIIRVDRRKANPRFVYYFFKDPKTFNMCQGIGGQAAQPNINLTILKGFDIGVPALPVQDAIVEVLSAYDNLIENNRRRIALLEEAARMLYREWFVHFRFPDHEHVKIIDRLPEGWTITGVKEAYDGLFDGPHATPTPSDEGPVFLGIQNIRETGGLDLFSIRHVSEADFPRWTRRVTPRDGDIVFSYEATLNRYALIPRGLRCCLGRRMALIRPKEEYRVFLFLHMFSDDWRRVIAGRILNGATVDRIPLTSFPSFPILLPARKAAAAFGETVEPQFKLIETLVEQNQKLIQARDLLLPRLMNGVIAV